MNNNVVIFTKYNDNILAIHFVDSKAVDMMMYPDSQINLKNVYRGKVKNIVKNINAAFVEVAPGHICFMSLEECRDIVVLNRERDAVDLKCGDEIAVQIIKGAVKAKAPVCSGRIQLPKAIKEEVLSKARTRTAFSVLYKSDAEYLQFLKRVELNAVDKIVCDNADIYESVDGYLSDCCDKCKSLDDKEIISSLRANTLMHNDEYSLNKLYKVESLIDEVTSKNVWLKSGANIVIEYTEAMTVIDVNSAKSIKDKSVEHILAVNLEAAEEIFRQIKLRNLSGMILIDFINDNEDNTSKLIEHIEELTKLDIVRCQYVDITGLGIVEITRSKKSRPLFELIK